MKSMSQDNKNKPGEFTNAMSMLSQIGVSIAVCLAVGILLGMFLDHILGSSPWLLIIFSLLGVVAAFRSIFELANKGK